MSEPEFRKKIQQAFNAIEAALADVDPDTAECEQAQVTMTITFADRSRCILSAQPLVRQLWVARAALVRHIISITSLRQVAGSMIRDVELNYSVI